jgi:hypothetical protein
VVWFDDLAVSAVAGGVGGLLGKLVVADTERGVDEVGLYLDDGIPCAWEASVGRRRSDTRVWRIRQAEGTETAESCSLCRKHGWFFLRLSPAVAWEENLFRCNGWQRFLNHT